MGDPHHLWRSLFDRSRCWRGPGPSRHARTSLHREAQMDAEYGWIRFRSEVHQRSNIRHIPSISARGDLGSEGISLPYYPDSRLDILAIHRMTATGSIVDR